MPKAGSDRWVAGGWARPHQRIGAWTALGLKALRCWPAAVLVGASSPLPTIHTPPLPDVRQTSSAGRPHSTPGCLAALLPCSSAARSHPHDAVWVAVSSGVCSSQLPCLDDVHHQALAVQIPGCRWLLGSLRCLPAMTSLRQRLAGSCWACLCFCCSCRCPSARVPAAAIFCLSSGSGTHWRGCC